MRIVKFSGSEATLLLYSNITSSNSNIFPADLTSGLSCFEALSGKKEKKWFHPLGWVSTSLYATINKMQMQTGYGLLS